MKLIDILIERLPALGGWPIDSDDERTLISSLPGVSWGLNGGGYYAFRGPNDSITYQQYEAAIVASKPEWDGEGLPPVGVEFEHSFHADGFSTWHWRKCTAVGKHGVLCIDENDTELYLNDTYNKFRPIRSEADNRRDEAAKGLIEYLDKETDIDNVFSINDVIGFYDAIAAGKIPHIRID